MPRHTRVRGSHTSPPKPRETGAQYSKYFGLFVSTGAAGGGQEATAISALSSGVHQGMIYVPLGYATTFHLVADVSEVRDGSLCGAGTFAAADGSRQPTTKELELAELQGKSFYELLSNVHFAKRRCPVTKEELKSTPTAAIVAPSKPSQPFQTDDGAAEKESWPCGQIRAGGRDTTMNVGVDSDGTGKRASLDTDEYDGSVEVVSGQGKD